MDIQENGLTLLTVVVISFLFVVGVIAVGFLIAEFICEEIGEHI